jgi:SAM-dependent methyltransferase
MSTHETVRALLAKYGDETGRDVYDQPAAFTAFVRGGGNVVLYERLSARLADGYDKTQPETLLDIGCGDGLALVPALESAGHLPARLDLVEPSAALLDAATKRLADLHTEVHTWQQAAQEFFAQLEDGRRWDRAQATFSLQSVPSDERVGVLRALREHTDVLTIAEFDVPEHVEGSPEHVRSLVTRYERGIAEYGDDAQLVARGFLLPVLLGQVDPRVSRTNWEQPAEKWAGQLAEAGFTDIDIEPLADYWWAPAVLISAT